MSPKTNAYRATLVIPTKNAGDLFERVVDGLRSQSCWNQIEFLVIDSGSTDNTIAIAKRAGAIVHTIPAAEFNHGATRDLAISLASCDSVILTVQDAIPNDPYVIDALLHALAEDGVAGAYARQIPHAWADVITKRNLNSWLTGRTEREVRFMPEPGWYDALPPMEKYLFCNFDNVCSAIRKSVWAQERFGQADFGEDIDWAERVLKRGYKIAYEPEASVTHSHDRPLRYEYKRTYVCHRKLYQQFGLRLLPTLGSVAQAWRQSLLSDMRFVAKTEDRLNVRVKTLLRVPVLNFLTALAQHRAVADEMRGFEKKVRGV